MKKFLFLLLTLIIGSSAHGLNSNRLDSAFQTTLWLALEEIPTKGARLQKQLKKTETKQKLQAQKETITKKNGFPQLRAKESGELYYAHKRLQPKSAVNIFEGLSEKEKHRIFKSLEELDLTQDFETGKV
jgi:hypothetical protein